MIAVAILHNEVRSNINKLNSNWDTHVNAVDIDTAINKSKDYLLNNYSILVEKDKRIEGYLRELELVHVPLKVEDINSNYVIAKLPEDYHNYLTVRGTAKKGDCVDDIKISKYFQRDDLTLVDPKLKPNWNWRRGCYNISGDHIYYYTNNEYAIESIELDYIKYIPDVAYPEGVPEGTYLTPDDKVIAKNVDLEITNPFIWRKIVEIATAFVHKNFNPSYTVDIQTIMFNETSAINN